MMQSYRDYQAQRRFHGLDGLRCVAIIAVVWHHSPHIEALPALARGFLGVDLFFVLSGFLIVTLLLREKASTGRISLTDFWMRRILRLMPAYYGLLVALLGAYLILKPGSAETQTLIDGFPVYALYLSNWFHPGANNLGPTWSLATEEQFYLLWPLAESLAPPQVTLGVWGGALGLNQLVNFGLLDGPIADMFGPEALGLEIMQTTFTPILLGVGLAHLLHAAQGYAIGAKLMGFRHAPYAYGLALLLLLNIPANDLSGALRLALHIAMTGLIGSIILSPGHFVTRVLETRPFVFVGGVSYGMYLYHLFCLHAASVLLTRLGVHDLPLAVFILTVAITTVVAAASFYLYEKRFLDMRKRFRASRSAAAAALS